MDDCSAKGPNTFALKKKKEQKLSPFYGFS